MFGIDLDTPITGEKLNEVLDMISKKIVDRGLEAPAVLFLEMHKPLSYIASQSVMVAMPLLGPFLGAQTMADFSKILKDRENIDLLITRIEDMAASKDEIGAGSAKVQE